MASVFPFPRSTASPAVTGDYFDYGDPMDISDTPPYAQHNYASGAQLYDDPMDISNTPPPSDLPQEHQRSDPYRYSLLANLNRGVQNQRVPNESPRARGHTTIFERWNETNPLPGNGPMATRMGSDQGQNQHSHVQNQYFLSRNAPGSSQKNRLSLDNHSSFNHQASRPQNHQSVEMDPHEELHRPVFEPSLSSRRPRQNFQLQNKPRFGAFKPQTKPNTSISNSRPRNSQYSQNPIPSTIPSKRTFAVSDPDEQSAIPVYHPTVYSPLVTIRDSWPEQGWGAVHELAEEGKKTGIDPFKETVHPYIPGAWPETPDHLDINMEDADASTGAQVPMMSGALPATPTKPPREFVPISPITTTIPGAYPDPDEITSDEFMAPQEDATEVPSSLGDPNAGKGVQSSWVAWSDTIRRIYSAPRGMPRTVVTIGRGVARLAGSVKRQALALFQRRELRRRERHIPPGRTSPTRASRVNIRESPAEQRRRLRIERWQRDSGFETPPASLPFPDIEPILEHHLERRRSIMEQVEASRYEASRFGANRVQTNEVDVEQVQTNQVEASQVETNRVETKEVDAEQVKTNEVENENESAITHASPYRHQRYQPYPRRRRRMATSTSFGRAVQNIQRQPLTERQPPAPPVNPDDPNFLPFGPAVSAVNLVRPIPKTIPPGRTQSVLAKEWRQMEKERTEKEKLEEKPKMRIRIEGPAVQPLTPEWEARVRHAMRKPRDAVVVTTSFGDELHQKDLATCYTPEAWLNDEVISAYLSLLVDYLRRTNNNAGRHDKPRFHAFSTFFFSNLRDKGYPSVRRWARRAKIGGPDLLNVETVFVPVHNRAHWTLVVVKPTERSIENFDSLGSLSQVHVNLIKGWLAEELGDEFVAEEWKVLTSASPQQTNGSDCGVFLLSTAKAVALGIDPLSYGPGDIPQLRRKVVGELMNGGLEGAFNPLEGKL